MSQATAASATPGSEVISSGRTFPCSIYKITALLPLVASRAARKSESAGYRAYHVHWADDRVETGRGQFGDDRLR